MSSAHDFDASGRLPGPGLFVLEASAGTGKTFTIAKLVRRFIAEDDKDISRLLAMTFGRSATQELRDRIRRELQRYGREADDPHAAQRAQRALADFDAAAIMTIHEFAADAFARFGVRADADPGTAVAEDLSDLVVESADDAYLELFADEPPLAGPGPDDKKTLTQDLTVSRARGIAREIGAHPDAELITSPVHPAPPEQERIDFAQEFRRRLARAKRRDAVVSFDDLVLRLRDAIADPEARQQLRDRFDVVLVDEFQDTDPAQWAIVRDAFLPEADHGPVVVLIGDPKQGIYSFRGADIHAYTQARDRADAHRQTLGTNYRSDGPVVAGVLDLLRGAEVGDGVVVHDVAANHADTRIHGPGMESTGRRVRLRVCRAPEGTKAGPLSDWVAQDVAQEIARTLREGAWIRETRTEDPDGEWDRPVTAGDFAVIVRTNAQAALVYDSLRRAGLPAVINSQVSVFASPAATAWLGLLRAMERPRGDRLRFAALTEFLDVDPAALALDTDASLTAVADRVAGLSTAFQRDGIPAVLAEALHPADGAGLYERMLARSDGERFLTDLRHVGSLLHAEHRRSRAALTALTDWLAVQMAEVDAETPERAEALTRRLDSDADAVQVVTIHRCKGLQYSIAYVPFGTSAPPGSGAPVVCTTDLGTSPPRMRRVIDVRSYPTNNDAAARRSETRRLKHLRDQESAAEELRMLYVAITRGVHEVVLTWAMAEHANRSRAPLHRLLHASGGVPAATYPSDPPLARAEASDHIALQHVRFPTVAAGPTAAATGPLTPPLGPLAAAAYERTDIDSAWARASFTSLTRAADPRPLEAVDDAAQGETTDEPAAVLEVDGDDSTDATITRSTMADLPSGAAFGTLVHAVLEHTRTDAADLDAELLQRCREQLERRPVRDLAPERLAEAMRPVLATPLGRLAPGSTLAGVVPGDRLPELDFELPLHQDRDDATTVAQIGSLVAAAATAPDWVRDYGRTLRDAAFHWRHLRGYLTGSIDAVLRIDGRSYVVDYKTNWLGDRLRDYRPEVLPAAMAEAHYPLQALLYQVALHRYLRLRQRGYDPERHLGGILYLFVRGMNGPTTPVSAIGDPCGVFSWQPDPAFVLELSALLGGDPE